MLCPVYVMAFPIGLSNSKLVLWGPSCWSWQLCQTLGDMKSLPLVTSRNTYGNGDVAPCCLRKWLCNLFKEMSKLCHLWTSPRLKTYFGYKCFKTVVAYFNCFFLSNTSNGNNIFEIFLWTRWCSKTELYACEFICSSWQSHRVDTITALPFWGNAGMKKWSPSSHW